MKERPNGFNVELNILGLIAEDFLGETLFFGYPKTKEGYGITFLMASAISIVGYIYISSNTISAFL